MKRLLCQKKPPKYSKFISFIVSGLKPRPFTKKRLNIEKLLREAKETKGLDNHYFKKLMFMSIGFVFTVVLIITVHQINIHNIVNLPSVMYLGGGMSFGSLSDEDMSLAMEITEYDNKVIGMADTEEEVKEYLNNEELEPAEVKAISERIMEKMNNLNKENFKWQEYMLAMLVGLICYFIPDMNVRIKRNIYKVEEDDEVSLYNSLILMLMDTHGIDSYEILKWLHLFSRIYKDELVGNRSL